VPECLDAGLIARGQRSVHAIKLNVRATKQAPMLLNIFSDSTVSSGNQLLVAYQQFGNMRSLVSSILQPELNMEKYWVRAMTHTKFTENCKSFLRMHTVIPVTTAFSSTSMNPIVQRTNRVFSLPLVIDHSTKPASIVQTNFGNRGENVHFMLQV